MQKQQIVIKRICLLFVALTLTPLRAAMIVILPLFVHYCNKIQPLKYAREIRILILLMVTSSIIGLLHGTTDVSHIVLSFWILLPIFLLLFSEPDNINPVFIKLLPYIKRMFLYILFVINIIGAYSWLTSPKIDMFGFGYGMNHYETVHGLAMIDTYFLLYFIISGFTNGFNRQRVLCILFFLFCIYGCQYGLGLICLFITFIVMLIYAKQLKSLLVLCIVLLIGIYALNTETFAYERENIEKAQKGEDSRKVTMFMDFLKIQTENIDIVLFGTGAGGYNSRTTNLLSRDTKNIFTYLLGNESQPPYYKKYIYPLWNKNFVSQASHTDGTRNKPYSNLISLWAEFGIVFFIVFVWLYYKQMKKVLQYKYSHHFESTYLLALDVFMIVSLISHLWLETSEFVLYCLIRLMIMVQIKHADDSVNV